MSKGKVEILPREVKVRLKEDVVKKKEAGCGGSGIFSLDKFSDGNYYETFGITHHYWGDGPASLVYIVKDDDGTLVEASCGLFTEF